MASKKKEREERASRRGTADRDGTAQPGRKGSGSAAAAATAAAAAAAAVTTAAAAAAARAVHRGTDASVGPDYLGGHSEGPPSRRGSGDAGSHIVSGLSCHNCSYSCHIVSLDQ